MSEQDALVEALEARRRQTLVWLVAMVGASEAEDVFQQALLIALERISQLRDTAHASMWFEAIVRRQALDLLRRRRTLQVVAEVADGAGGAGGPCPCILLHIQQISPEYRELLWLVEVLELGVGEVAHALLLSPTNASMRLARARRVLRAAAQPCYGDHPLREHECHCM
jgi:DNA-directed RNA polymerase specialized sigma24 family protein